MFAVIGVGGFFAFLVSFLSVSAYFGGGVIGIGVSLVLAISVATGLLILWPRLRGQTVITFPPQVASPPTFTPPSGGQSQLQLCDPGPYEVVNGDTVKLPLDVKTGDKIEGYVREINNDFFDWFIVDENEMVRFFDVLRCKPIAGRKNVTVSKVSCRVAGSGPYYLLLDIGSRLNDRQVEVVLRRRS